MRQAIRQRVTIQPGGRVGTIAPELTAGNEAEAVILEELSPSSRCLADLVGCGRGAFSSPEEADHFIRRERDAWD